MFLRKFFWLQIISLCLIVKVFALDFNPPVYTIEDTFFFEGDSHGEFKGDYVAILSDGSCWKVHPGDRYKFSLWNSHDVIRVRKRNTFYWYKREHKFELYNYCNDETVRVMLVKYPFYPIQILATDIYKAETALRTFTWVDSQGWTHYEYYTEDVFHKILYLSNGSAWVIEKKAANFLIIA